MDPKPSTIPKTEKQAKKAEFLPAAAGKETVETYIAYCKVTDGKTQLSADQLQAVEKFMLDTIPKYLANGESRGIYEVLEEMEDVVTKEGDAEVNGIVVETEMLPDVQAALLLIEDARVHRQEFEQWMQEQEAVNESGEVRRDTSIEAAVDEQLFGTSPEAQGIKSQEREKAEEDQAERPLAA